MIYRTTTIGNLKNYRYNLNYSMTTMSTAMGKITTQRNFNSFAENPSIAARAFQLRHAYLRTSSQYEANDALVHKYDVAWSSLDTVEKNIDTINNSGFYNLIRAENGPDASGRNALGQDMSAKAKTIAQTMNDRYSENYVFSGADTLNPPFTWEPHENPDYVEDFDLTKLGDPYTIGADGKDYSAAFMYVAKTDTGTAEGKPIEWTNNEADSIKIPRANPDYVPGSTYDPDDPTTMRYLRVDKTPGGHDMFVPTDDETLADKVPYVNPDYDPEKFTNKYIKSSVTIQKGAGEKQTITTYTNTEAEAEKKLHYRGLMVDCGEGSTEDERLTYYTNGEKKYIDIGLGHKEVNGEAVPSTLQNSALQGVYYLGGYGTKEVTVRIDEDDPNTEYTVTVPTNIASVMSRLGTIMQNCDPDDGRFASDAEHAEFLALAQQFEDTSSLVKQRYTELDTTSSFLKANEELLVSNADSLQDQFMGLEDVDPAFAISDFMFARYAYDTALKVGNSLLSQSLMDYLNI